MKRKLLTALAIASMMMSTACSNTVGIDNEYPVATEAVESTTEIATDESTEPIADSSTGSTGSTANNEYYDEISALYKNALSEDNYTQKYEISVDFEGMPEYSTSLIGTNKVETGKAMDATYSMWMGGTSGTKIMDISMNFTDNKVYMDMVSDLLGGENKACFDADFEQVIGGTPASEKIFEQLDDSVSETVSEIRKESDGYTLVFDPNSELMSEITKVTDEVSNIETTERLYVTDGKLTSAEINIGADAKIEEETKKVKCIIKMSYEDVGSTNIGALTEAEKAEYSYCGDFANMASLTGN